MIGHKSMTTGIEAGKFTVVIPNSDREPG